MGFMLILLGCLFSYYAVKVWNDFKAANASWGSTSSTQRKTRNEMNRYNEIQRIKYENRD